MIDRLSDLGLPVIEVSSFAHPKIVPHLRDAEDVFERIQRRPGTTYRALVPNAHGARGAVTARVDEILGLITISATYTKKNQNMSIEDAIEQNPQYRARENIKMTVSRIGSLAVPGVVPRLSATPGETRWLGEGLGAQNEEILQGLLGLDGEEVRTLRAQGVI
jgi:hypothetical protein